MARKPRSLPETLTYDDQWQDRLPKDLKGFSEIELHQFMVELAPGSIAYRAADEELQRRRGRPALIRSTIALVLSAVAVTVSIVALVVHWE